VNAGFTHVMASMLPIYSRATLRCWSVVVLAKPIQAFQSGAVGTRSHSAFAECQITERPFLESHAVARHGRTAIAALAVCCVAAWGAFEPSQLDPSGPGSGAQRRQSARFKLSFGPFYFRTFFSRYVSARRTTGFGISVLLWSSAWDRLVKSMFAQSVANWCRL
jgi:hypothetical protein